jgi:exodeoxyribonuclease VII large subunit
VLRALQADGLLAANRSLTFAAVPLRVGLVTSAGSAAYHDFVHELERSGLAFQVCLADVRVQGAGASKRLTWGLRALTQVPLDVVVVVRGGGSRSDLTAFDAEGVARAIASMPVPVLTGIGHEIDRTVADEVAYASHKTPTACAQALVDRVCEFVDRLDHVSRRVAERARHACTLAHRDLRNATERARRGVPVALARELAELERRRGRAEEVGVRSTRDAAARLVRAERAVAVAAPRGLRDAERRLETAEARLRALDPRRVLERGYSITHTDDGRVAREASAIGVGETLVTELAAGTVTSRVEGTDTPEMEE